MTLDVWMPDDPGGAFRAHLDRLLAEGVRVREEPDDAVSVLVRGVPTDEQLDRCPRLRAVIVPYAGIPGATRERLLARPHLALHNLHHNAAPTAEHALALMLAAARSLVPADRALRAGDWRPRWDPRADPLLEGGVAVVFGMGEIGRRLAVACRALGMDVQGVRRSGPRDGDPVPVHPPAALDGLLPRARVLFVTLPLTPDTKGAVGAGELARLPDGAIVVNVGRGPVVDEEALYDACASGRLRAGLDVWYRYPRSEAERTTTHPSGYPFHELDSVVLSPHRGGHSDRMDAMRAEHLARLLACAARGERIPNRVDPARGY